MKLGDLELRDELAEELCARIRDPHRTLDEIRVASELFARLELGAVRYGGLDLEKARDWARELAEELLDVQVYRAIRALIGRQT